MKHLFLPKDGSADLWVILHGFMIGRGFIDRCRMHDHTSVLYPYGPKAWRKRHRNKILNLIDTYSSEYKRVILAGHSMGGEYIFYYCSPLIDGLVCYSGMNNKCFRQSFRPPTLYVVGQDESLPTKDHTIAMYEEDVDLGYDTDLIFAPGRHKWNSQFNLEILSHTYHLLENPDGRNV